MWSVILHIVAAVSLLNAAVWAQLTWGLKHCVAVLVSGILTLALVHGIVGAAVCAGGALLVAAGARWSKQRGARRRRPG